MLVKQSGDSPLLKTFRVHYRSGAQDFVRAHGYTYEPQSDEILFFDYSNNQTVAVFPQASGIRSVIDLDYIPEAPAITELQSRIISLEARVEELEKSGLQ